MQSSTTKADVCFNTRQLLQHGERRSFDYENPSLQAEEESEVETKTKNRRDDEDDVEVACDGDHMKMYLGSFHTENEKEDDYEGLNSIVVEK